MAEQDMSNLQQQLRRFETAPAAPACDRELLHRLTDQQDILASYGFDPTEEIVDIAAAFDQMTEFVRGGKGLSTEAILSLHRTISAHLDDCDAGEYRCDQRLPYSASASRARAAAYGRADSLGKPIRCTSY